MSATAASRCCCSQSSTYWPGGERRNSDSLTIDPSLIVPSTAMPSPASGSLELTITPLPAFNDNYLWLLTRGREAAVVDPGDAAPVRQALERLNLRLCAILVTHHHGDHVGGVVELKARTGAT